jgi:hypothetical protein
VCERNTSVGGRRSRLIVALLLLTACAPVFAHHQSPPGGAIIGLVIPAITHGEMLVVAEYGAEILDLAAREPRSDPTLHRLTGFVSLQRFACFWGLIPGSLSDETSPFNECSHAYVAGSRALLLHMTTMPGDQSSARELEARIQKKIDSDPSYSMLCLNSSEAFDTGIIISPDWKLAPAHLPTVLTFFAGLALTCVGFGNVWRLIRTMEFGRLDDPARSGDF